MFPFSSWRTGGLQKLNICSRRCLDGGWDAVQPMGVQTPQLTAALCLCPAFWNSAMVGVRQGKQNVSWIWTPASHW